MKSNRTILVELFIKANTCGYWSTKEWVGRYNESIDLKGTGTKSDYSQMNRILNAMWTNGTALKRTYRGIAYYKARATKDTSRLPAEVIAKENTNEI